MKTANVQRWSIRRVLSYLATLLIAVGIAHGTGQLDVFKDKLAPWAFLAVAAAILFFIEFIWRSYGETYAVGREGIEANVSRLRELYDRGMESLEGLRQFGIPVKPVPMEYEIVSWCDEVSTELAVSLPADKFGFDTVEDLIPRDKWNSKPQLATRLEKRLEKLRAIIMRVEAK
jgi:hypothetical protein